MKIFFIVQALSIDLNIDYDKLGAIGLTGKFNSLSYDVQPQLNPSSISIINFENNQTHVIGTTPLGNKINSMCLLDDILFIGGLFNQINNVQAANFIKYDTQKKEFTSLGVDGEVRDLYCNLNTKKVHLVGSFTSNLIQFDLNGYLIWESQNNKWNIPFFKGLDGPIHQIRKIDNKTVLLTGDFNNTIDDGKNQDLFRYPVPNLSIYDASKTQLNGLNCNQTSMINGFLIMKLPFSMNISSIILYNQDWKTIGFFNAETNQPIIGSFIDAKTRTRQSCNNGCTLSNDPNYANTFELDTLNLKYLKIQPIDYYSSSNLRGVQLYSMSNYNGFGSPSSQGCTKEIVQWNTNGNSLSVADNQYNMMLKNETSIKLNIQESGTYEVYLNSATCANCNVIIKTNFLQEEFAVNIQTTHTLIYKGYLHLQDQPQLILSSGDSIQVQNIQINRISSMQNLNGILRLYDSDELISLPSSLPSGFKITASCTFYDGFILVGYENTKAMIYYFINEEYISLSLPDGFNGIIKDVISVNEFILISGEYSIGDNWSSLAKFDVVKQMWYSLDVKVNAGQPIQLKRYSNSEVMIITQFPNSNYLIYNMLNGDHKLENYLYGSLMSYGDKYYAGQFSEIGLVYSPNLAYLNNNTLINSNFNLNGQVNSGVIYKKNITILGGQFQFGKIQNIGYQFNQTYYPFNFNIIGNVKDLLVVDKYLLIAGEFQNSFNQTGFMIYDLEKEKVNTNLTPSNDITRVNQLLRVPNSNLVALVGKFQSNLVFLDLVNMKWLLPNNDSNTPDGEIIKATNYQNSLVCIYLNNQLVSYNLETKSWTPLSISLPSSPTDFMKISNTNWYSSTMNLFLYGQNYLGYYNGTGFTVIQGLDIKNITNLDLIPIKNSTLVKRDFGLLPSDYSLLISGDFNINNMPSNLAYYNQNWQSMLTANSGSNVKLIYNNDPSTLNNQYLPLSLIILISVAISLTIVFFIVLIGLIIIYMKRNRSMKYGPNDNYPFTDPNLIVAHNVTSTCLEKTNNEYTFPVPKDTPLLEEEGKETIKTHSSSKSCDDIVTSNWDLAPAEQEPYSKHISLSNTSSLKGKQLQNVSPKLWDRKTKRKTELLALLNTPSIMSSALSHLDSRKCKVVFDFKPEEQGEIVLRKDQIITIEDDEDETWWLGSIDQAPDLPLIRGVFPASFVTKL